MTTTEKTSKKAIELSLFLFGETKSIVKHCIEKGEEETLWLIKSWKKTYNVA
jgi:hypothetical protein